jgi:hypothetical protein
MCQEQFDSLPTQITLRLLRLQICAPGFRTRSILLVTTLLDLKLYPCTALSELYRRRWAIELFWRDIKTTMKMDVLRCQSPTMIEKELAMQPLPTTWCVPSCCKPPSVIMYRWIASASKAQSILCASGPH